MPDAHSPEALRLPPHPNLEQYRNLAKDLRKACKSGDPLAIRGWATRWVEKSGSNNEPDGIERRWNTLKRKSAQIANCTLAGAQFFIAREHGFTNWPKFTRHVQELARANSPVAAFEAAADAIVNGGSAALKSLLADHPALTRQRSTRDHCSTLLHYVSANGIENFRQKTPRNIVEVANLLLDAGAEVDAESDAYGGGCTALGLVATSVHPERAGVQIALLQTLLDCGASLQLRSAGNNHSIVRGCLANGQPAAARFLADRGAPLDFESAAAIGQVDLLRNYLDRDEVSAKQLESAFLYACGYGSLAAARFLLEQGVDPAARNADGQTALHWAAWGPQNEIIELLLERGAPVDIRDNRFHATPLDTALWTWSNAPSDGARHGCYPAISQLVRAGGKLDSLNGPALIEKINADPRMQAALRGETER